MAVITISRTFGSGGDEIALGLCHELGYQLFDKTLVNKAAREAGLQGIGIIELTEDTYTTLSFMERLFGRAPAVPFTGVWPEDLAVMAIEEQVLSEEDTLALTREAVRWSSQMDDMIILGRGSQVILRERPNVLHLRIDAPLEERVARVARQYKPPEAGEKNGPQKRQAWAKSLVQSRDAASAEYIKRFYQADWADPLLYDLVINTHNLSTQHIIRMVSDLAYSMFKAQDPAERPE
jgi:cytidylate kinase